MSLTRSHDQLTVDSKDYVYRDGYWTTPTGYRVSTSQGQLLTVAFYHRNGRVPGASVPVPVPVRPARRARTAQG